MAYTFIINLGVYEDSLNASIIANLYPASPGDPAWTPDLAIRAFIRMLLGMFDRDAQQVRHFLWHFSRGTTDTAGDQSLFEQGIDWWGTIQSGTIIFLNGLDLLFDDDPYEKEKFSVKIMTEVEIQEKNISEYTYEEELLQLPALLKKFIKEEEKPTLKKCPYCRGEGEIPS